MIQQVSGGVSALGSWFLEAMMMNINNNNNNNNNNQTIRERSTNHHSTNTTVSSNNGAKTTNSPSHKNSNNSNSSPNKSPNKNGIRRGSRPLDKDSNHSHKQPISQYYPRGGGVGGGINLGTAAANNEFPPPWICYSWWFHALLFFLATGTVVSYGLSTWHWVLLLQQPQQQPQLQLLRQLPLSPTTTLLLSAYRGDNTIGGHQSNSIPNNRDHSLVCSFRRYPPHRFYELSQPREQVPDFLKNSDYIYGQWPKLLLPTTSSTTTNTLGKSNSRTQMKQQKLCVDQSEWLLPPKKDKQDITTTTTATTATTTTTTTTIWPFADGTNPSIISMQRYREQVAPEYQFDFLKDKDDNDNNNNNSESNNGRRRRPNDDIAWIATICMTNSQCVWKDTDAAELKTTPDTIRTLVLFLNDQFETVEQATIYLHLNVPQYGRYYNSGGKKGRKTGLGLPPRVKTACITNSAATACQEEHEEDDENYYMPALDDARLFIYNKQLWISYREGKLFGYESQVLNPLHLQRRSQSTRGGKNGGGGGGEENGGFLTATILSSETTSFCCGRNMALLTTTISNKKNNHTHIEDKKNHNIDPLLAVTWVDPVTVVTVDTTPHVNKDASRSRHRRRRLLTQDTIVDGFPQITTTTTTTHLLPPPSLEDRLEEEMEEESKQQRRQRRRRLLGSAAIAATIQQKKKSHVHGTNAFMVYLPQRQEYLGVAHFHRPSDRQANRYARFGHHYTHAFYTIAAASVATTVPPATTTTTATTLDYRLMTLSPEFVLPAAAPSSTNTNQDDAEIIQFISGLEYDETTNQVILAYGINDCEGAILAVDYETVVEPLLKIVPPPLLQSSSSLSASLDTTVSSTPYSSLQVVDLMEPLVQQLSQQQRQQQQV